MNSYERTIWTVLRLSFGWVFLWAFLDKLLGLGLSTCRDKVTGVVTNMCDAAWISGGSPTTDFLTDATQGPLANIFQAMANLPVVDWLFMIGLAGIGIALLLGVLTRIAVASAVVLMLLMYIAVIPPSSNPFVDYHIIYALTLLLLAPHVTETSFSFSKWWSKQPVVKQMPWLR